MNDSFGFRSADAIWLLVSFVVLLLTVSALGFLFQTLDLHPLAGTWTKNPGAVGGITAILGGTATIFWRLGSRWLLHEMVPPIDTTHECVDDLRKELQAHVKEEEDSHTWIKEMWESFDARLGRIEAALLGRDRT